MKESIDTLYDERQRVEKNLKEGCFCKACYQRCQEYPRKITSSMAYGILLVYKKTLEDGATWIHIEEFFKKNTDISSSIRGDMSKFKFWGLMEKKPGKRDDGSKRNGYWRITDAGKAFVEHRLRVPKTAFVYNDEVRKLSDERVSIKDAFKNRFNYNELIKGYDHNEDEDKLMADSGEQLDLAF